MFRRFVPCQNPAFGKTSSRRKSGVMEPQLCGMAMETALPPFRRPPEGQECPLCLFESLREFNKMNTYLCAAPLSSCRDDVVVTHGNFHGQES